MLMLCLIEIIDQMAMESSVCWYGDVLRMALEFEAERQRKKETIKDTEELG